MTVLAVGQGRAVVMELPEQTDERLAMMTDLQHGVMMISTAGSDTDYRSMKGLARFGLAPQVRLHPCEAPPTLLTLLSAVIRAGRFGPGDVFEVLAALRAVSTTLAIIGSVSQLRHPSPSIVQHLRGALPGGRFVVDLPGQQVLSGHGALSKLRRVHGAAIVVASAADSTSLGWRAELRALAPQAPCLDIDRTDPASVGWRSARWAEFTALAVPVQEFAARLDTYLARRPCSSCGTLISGTICPICGVVCSQPPAGRRHGVATG